MPTGSNFILGVHNSATDPTELSAPTIGAGLDVKNPGGDGVSGNAFGGTGIIGTSVNGAGVDGESLNGPGVRGGGPVMGVLGTGLRGDGIGVQGVGPRGGVFGSATRGVGVFGDGPMAGMSGTAGTGGFGVNGQTLIGFGVRGLAVTPAGSGVAAIGRAGGTALFADAPFPGTAGVFNGDLVVTGAKSATVPFPDGSRRLLYCMESAESWFEDFGTARLVRGRATVKLDRGFAAVVRRDQLRVFLTPEGDCRGLYVSRKSAGGFEVRELQGETSTLRFTYRVVARRRDVEAPRFARKRLPEKPRGADQLIPAPEISGASKAEKEKRRFIRKPRRASRRRTRG